MGFELAEGAELSDDSDWVAAVAVVDSYRLSIRTLMMIFETRQGKVISWSALALGCLRMLSWVGIINTSLCLRRFLRFQIVELHPIVDAERYSRGNIATQYEFRVKFRSEEREGEENRDFFWFFILIFPGPEFFFGREHDADIFRSGALKD